MPLPFTPAGRGVLGSGGRLPTLDTWKAAKARVLAGTGRGSIGFIGDSTMMGLGASGVPGGGANATNGARAYNMPSLVAAKLATGGVATRTSSLMGTSNVSPTSDFPAYDGRIGALTTGWLASNTGAAAGGTDINQPGANTGAFSITFPENCDTVWFQYLQGTGGGGSFTVNVDGGATLATISTSGADGIGTATVTFAAGAGHTVNFARSTGSAVRIFAVRAWLSTGFDIACHNIGVSGARTDTLNTNVYASAPKLSQLRQYACDLWVIILGINNGFASTPIATFKTEYQNIITACKASGDVVLLTPYPANGSTGVVQASYIAAIRELATSNRAFVVETNALFGGTYAAANALGWMYDGTHPNQTGYDQASTLVSNFLLAA